MKAKTQKQVYITQLAERLPPLHTYKLMPELSKCFSSYATIFKTRTFCLECAHSWKTEQTATKPNNLTCPNCGKKLILKDYQKRFKHNEYFGILSTIDNMQVVRMIFVTKRWERGLTPTIDYTEVMQHFVDTKGDISTLARKVMGMSWYYDQWILDSPMEFRSYTDREHLRLSLTPIRIHPRKKVLPIIRRNGFKSKYHDLPPHKLFSILLQNPMAETLLKAGQIDMLTHLYHYPYVVADWWKSIKICIRNKYIIQDATLWLDMIALIHRQGKDTLNPKYVCPENLKKAHDKWEKKQEKIDEREDRIRKAEKREEEIRQLEIDAQKFEQEKQKFFDINFSDGEISIQVLKSIEEFKTEGSLLKHCVFTNKYYNKADSLILSARIDNTPTETIEVSLSTLNIVQARGFSNEPTPYHDRIVNLVKTNIPKIAQKVA